MPEGEKATRKSTFLERLNERQDLPPLHERRTQEADELYGDLAPDEHKRVLECQAAEAKAARAVETRRAELEGAQAREAEARYPTAEELRALKDETEACTRCLADSEADLKVAQAATAKAVRARTAAVQGEIRRRDPVLGVVREIGRDVRGLVGEIVTALRESRTQSAAQADLVRRLAAVGCRVHVPRPADALSSAAYGARPEYTAPALALIEGCVRALAQIEAAETAAAAARVAAAKKAADLEAAAKASDLDVVRYRTVSHVGVA